MTAKTERRAVLVEIGDVVEFLRRIPLADLVDAGAGASALVADLVAEHFKPTDPNGAS